MEITINGVKYKNVPDKRYGTKVNDILTQSNIGISADVAAYIQSQDFYALVNSLDIDWNGIEIDSSTIINTTSDLIKWLKSIASSSTSKQDKLVSGQNIKTVNNQSILGSGNIDIESGGGTQDDYARQKANQAQATAETAKNTANEAKNLASQAKQDAATNTTELATAKTRIESLENSGFITRLVTDLENYYRKSETYTQEQINSMLATVEDFEPVIGTRPASGEAMKIYFEANQGGDSYSEYLWDGTKYVLLATHNGDIASLLSQECMPSEKTKASSSHATALAIENATSFIEVYTIADCTVTNSLLKPNGDVYTIDGYAVSNPIPISKHHSKLRYYDLWTFGADAWRSLIVYNDNGEVIASKGANNKDRYGEIDLKELSNPSYFRFAKNVSDITESGYTACVVLISNNSKLDNLSSFVLDNSESPELSIIEFNNSNTISNGYALLCDGNLLETSNDDHYTSGFYELFPSSIITATNTFIRSDKWAGIILYDKDRLPIATFGGNVNISIKEIPTAKYFRFFVTKSDNYTVRYTLPKSKDSSILREDRSILTNNRLVYDNTYCTLANTGINYDGSLHTIESDLTLNCTPKIPIGNAKYLMHCNIWTYSADRWCSLAIYDNNNNVLYRGKRFNVVDLKSLGNPSYFRYVMSTGDFTDKDRQDKPVVILSMSNRFTEKNVGFDVAEYVNLETEYRDNSHSNTNSTGWGFNYPSPVDINVNNIEISYSSSHSSIGDVINCYIGSIDQRGWFILRTTAKIELVSQDLALNINYYKPLEGFVIKKNELCIVDCGYFITYTVLNSASKYGEMVNMNGGNTSSFAIRNDHVTLCHFVITGSFVDANSLSSTSDVDINDIEEEIALGKVLTDTSTGNKYELLVNDGVLGIKDITVHKILVIGNSYTTHENASTTWQGNGRGMAASVNSTQYTEFIKRATGAELDILRGVDFERGYSTSFNFSSAFPINKEYDVVIVQLNENAAYSSTMQASWAALYDYIRNRLSNANIIQVIGASTEAKTNAITAAASPRNIPVLDCTEDKEIGKYWLGCYVTGADGNYYEIVNSGVSAGHPSDVGMYFIARRILRTLKYTIDNPLRKIFVNEVDGGTIALPYNSWTVGGVVNVLCSSNISALSVIRSNGNAVQATQRVNSNGVFYTFIMPDDSVTITPTWNL